MLAYTYEKEGCFRLIEKEKPVIQDDRDAIVRVTLASICTSDLHIKHGSVPKAVPGITVGHEMVGIVEAVGSSVSSVKPGDRVTVKGFRHGGLDPRQGTFIRRLPCGYEIRFDHGYTEHWSEIDLLYGMNGQIVPSTYAPQGLKPETYLRYVQTRVHG